MDGERFRRKSIIDNALVWTGPKLLKLIITVFRIDISLVCSTVNFQAILRPKTRKQGKHMQQQQQEIKKRRTSTRRTTTWTRKRTTKTITTKTLTSFKSTSFCEILNFALWQSLVVNPELVHLPLEKSLILVLPYSRMRIPVLRQETLPSTLCLQSTINEDLSNTRVCVVRSNNVVPNICGNDWICKKFMA